ncbi:MAG: AMP-dependent synthetase, partial [Proteobacteria bacterium]
YQDFYRRSGALAKRLGKDFGIAKGDRVAVFAHNEPETFFLFFAPQRLGAILVPVNFRFTAREVDHVLEDSGARLLFFGQNLEATVLKLKRPPVCLKMEGPGGLREMVQAMPEGSPDPMAAEPEDSVMILYTSGTTGAPKGALINHRMLFWNSVNTGLRLNITADDKTLIFHPLFHTSGWNVLSTPFFHHGASIVMLKKFDPCRVLELCGEERLTILFGVPTMMERMSRAENFNRADLSSLRFSIVGGEPMAVPLIETWGTHGVPVRQGFGLTEFGPGVFSLEAADGIRKAGSIGFPNFYVETRVLNHSGTEARVNEVGELLLRGPVCTPGYWNDAAATAAAIRDGWFHTGDLVRVDEEGFFYVVGRKKEVFISGGENIYPAEIESYLGTLPGIREVAVVGVKDERWGEVGKCFYATKENEPVGEEALRAFCEEGLARYKIPKFFTQLADLPKGPSGKIQRRALIV